MIDFKAIISRMNRDVILVVIAIVGVVVIGGMIYADSNPGSPLSVIFGSSESSIGEKVINYINGNDLAGSPASLVSVSRESGMFKVRINIDGSEFDSYVSKDGRFLFPASDEIPFDMNEFEESSQNGESQNTGKTAEEILAEIQKSDKPLVEAFVVSRCPFGLQMQRMIADAIANIPALAQYIKVEYIGDVSSDGKTITAMHGEEEAQENLRQICIRDEQPAKYWGYVSCYMKAGDSTSCLTSSGINVPALNACVSTPSRGVAYAQKDFDLAYQFNALGSPTLIVNGAETSEFTDGGDPVFGSSRSSDEIKTIVCAAFNTPPAFCSTILNPTQAAAGLSVDYSSGDSSGGQVECE